MMLAKLFLAFTILYMGTQATYFTGNSQTCTTHCTNNDEPRINHPHEQTLIRGKAGPKGQKGEDGQPGKVGRPGKHGRAGRDCEESGINTKITQIESSVNGKVDAMVTELDTANETAYERYEEMQTKLDAANSRVDAMVTELSAANERYEEMQTKLDTANDKIAGLEEKMQILIPVTGTPATNTPVPSTPESSTSESSTSVPSTSESNTSTAVTSASALSDEERIKLCGLISTIEDSRITADSVFTNDPKWGTQHSRLYSTSGYGAWLSDVYYAGWIQVDLLTNINVRGVAIQPPPNSWNWVKTFSISFRTATSNSFKNVEDQSGSKVIFQGNTELDTPVINDVDIEARFIRIHPLTWLGAPMMRFDVLTC